MNADTGRHLADAQAEAERWRVRALDAESKVDGQAWADLAAERDALALACQRVRSLAGGVGVVMAEAVVWALDGAPARPVTPQPAEGWPNIGDKILYAQPARDGEGTAWQQRRTAPSLVVGILQGDDEPPRVRANVIEPEDGWTEPDQWFAYFESVRIVERATYTPAGAGGAPEFQAGGGGPVRGRQDGRPRPGLTAAEFNEAYPPGTPVRAWPGGRRPEDRHLDTFTSPICGCGAAAMIDGGPGATGQHVEWYVCPPCGQRLDECACDSADEGGAV